MSIKALFGSKEPKPVPQPPVEETVSDISKDLVTTIAKLEARTKALDVKISLAEAAAAAANEAKRQIRLKDGKVVADEAVIPIAVA